MKTKPFTWKWKNRLLLAGAGATLWLVYAFAVSNTLDARAQCETLQQQLDSATGAPGRLTQLKEELQRLEAITGRNDSTHALHEQLLGIVTGYCAENGLTLRDFAPPVRYETGEWTVETHPVTVEGAYVPLLKLVRKLEQEQSGKVVSVDFHSKRDNKTQVLSLTVTIYVQNIIRSEKEITGENT